MNRNPYELLFEIAVIILGGLGYGAFCRRFFYWRGAYAFVQYSRFGLQMFAPLLTFFLFRAWVGDVHLTFEQRFESYRDIVLYTLGGMGGFFLADRPVESEKRALPIRASFRVTGNESDEIVVIEPKPLRRQRKPKKD